MNPNVYRDLDWNTNNAIYGWALQGIYNRLPITVNGNSVSVPPDSDVNCISRLSTTDLMLVAVAGMHTTESAIKLFRYPTLADSFPCTVAGGHTSPVTDMAFISLHSGPVLASLGGNDCCVFLWDVVS